MRLWKAGAVYSVIVGIIMIGTWTTLYVTDSIPEIRAEPIRIIMHILAEMVTAVTLIIGGIGFLTSRRWGFPLYLVSTGMLLYTLIVSPGYYAQKGEITFVGMFTVLIALAVIFLGLSFSRKERVKGKR